MKTVYIALNGMDYQSAGTFELDAYSINVFDTSIDVLKAAETKKPEVVIINTQFSDSTSNDYYSPIKSMREIYQIPIIMVPNAKAIDDVLESLNNLKEYDTSFTKVSEGIYSIIEKQEIINYCQHYDILTGLEDISAFKNSFERCIARADRDFKHISLMVISLNDLTTINARHGKKFGDLALIETVHLIQSNIRRGDFLARLGSDTFGLMLHSLKREFDGFRVAEQIIEDVNQIHHLGEKEIEFSLSIGIASLKQEDVKASTFEDLLSGAYKALNQAKTIERSNFQFFDSNQQLQAKEYSKIRSGLETAIFENQLQIYYQPQVSPSGQLIGLEALLRWCHPELGWVSPAKFIPIAEESGLIHEIGRWVLREACQQMAQLPLMNLHADITLSVNVSPIQFRAKKFINYLQEALDDSGIKPSNLIIELTESALVDDKESTIKMMESIKALGVEVALDDFGTGYSSLCYLCEMPLDKLKIDLSFIQQIGHSIKAERIIKTIIDLAHKLSLQVTAEGVENQDQLNFLIENQCEYIQGYYFQKPSPLAEIYHDLGQRFLMQ